MIGQVSSIMDENKCNQGILLPHFGIPRTKRRFYRLPMEEKLNNKNQKSEWCHTSQQQSER